MNQQTSLGCSDRLIVTYHHRACRGTALNVRHETDEAKDTTVASIEHAIMFQRLCNNFCGTPSARPRCLQNASPFPVLSVAQNIYACMTCSFPYLLAKDGILISLSLSTQIYCHFLLPRGAWINRDRLFPRLSGLVCHSLHCW